MDQIGAVARVPGKRLEIRLEVLVFSFVFSLSPALSRLRERGEKTAVNSHMLTSLSWLVVADSR